MVEVSTPQNVAITEFGEELEQPQAMCPNNIAVIHVRPSSMPSYFHTAQFRKPGASESAIDRPPELAFLLQTCGEYIQ